MPDEIRETQNLMKLTRAYNRATGANLTHWEFAEVGIIEETKVMLSLEFLAE